MERVRKIKDYGKFTNELQEREPKRIIVEPEVRLASYIMSTESMGGGKIGNYIHSLFYSVETQRHELVYREGIFVAFQSERGIAHALERERRAASLFLAAEVRIDTLHELFPNTIVQLGNGQGEPIDQISLNRLREEVAELGVDSPL